MEENELLQAEVELLEDKIIGLEKSNKELRNEVDMLRHQQNNQSSWGAAPQYSYQTYYRPSAQQQANVNTQAQQALANAMVYGQAVQGQTSSGSAGLQGESQNDQGVVITRQNWIDGILR